MLPLQLSNNLTSLNEHVERFAVVVELTIDPNGFFTLKNLSLALVKNHAKLTYSAVARFLEDHVRLEGKNELVHTQLSYQDVLTQRINSHRAQKGALAFATKELQAIITQAGLIQLEEKKENRAHKLIENSMIAANVVITNYLHDLGIPTLRRIVRVPKKWSRIVDLARNLGERLPPNPNANALRSFLLKEQQTHPEKFQDLSLAIIKLIGKGEYVLGTKDTPPPGHFNLALTEYSHTTAPNRRFPDLVMQRLLKNHLAQELGKVPYSKKELLRIAKDCTEKEHAAAKVERKMLKSAAASILMDKIKKHFKGMITGSSSKGVWVRLYDPPIEGRVTQNHQDLDVGDIVTVELIRVDIRNGHIDFRKIDR